MTIIAVRAFVRPDNDKHDGMPLNDLIDYLDNMIIDTISSEGWEVVKITVKEAKR